MTDYDFYLLLQDVIEDGQRLCANYKKRKGKTPCIASDLDILSHEVQRRIDDCPEAAQLIDLIERDRAEALRKTLLPFARIA